MNEREAKRVREIFDLYLNEGTLAATVEALNARGWRTKAWKTRDGRMREGVRWTKCTLRTMLINPIYTGRTRLKKEVFDGEHPAVLPDGIFEAAQQQMARLAPRRGRRTGGQKGQALLSGLLQCGPCAVAMSPSHTRRRDKVYRYYVCGKTRSENWKACPSPSVSAHVIEDLVVGQIRAIGQDRMLQAAVLNEVRAQGIDVEPADLRRALALFDGIWGVLHLREQTRVLRLLLEGITYDGAAGTVALAFRPTGIQALAEEVTP